ncbi:MAG: DUF1194 domain-containing protein [Rhodospirillales bacterium]|nr:DUF1194 domain-containing protein [Rhodospirillales bacterium]
MCGFFRQLLAALVITGPVVLAGISAAVAAERTVDLELVLAVDVSGSMDEDEHLLQRQGYVEAFRHPGVVEVIRSGFYGRIAVTYFEWAGASGQVITVPWTEISDAPSASAFADYLASQPIAYIRGTSISGGILFATTLFPTSGFRAARRVIDISGDGTNNRGGPVEPARDYAVSLGLTINGLPLLLKEYWGGGISLDVYYRDCVIGGPGAFVVAVKKPDQMARAIRRKLILEIAGPVAGPVLASTRVQTRQTDCLIGEKRWQSRDFE